jgi:hypothetical protein
LHTKTLEACLAKIAVNFQSSRIALSGEMYERLTSMINLSSRKSFVDSGLTSDFAFDAAG